MILKRTSLSSTTSFIKRNFATIHRTVCLDELLRHPILDRASADPDTLQDLDAFPVPILPGQLSDSLRREFGQPITTKTDWSFAPSTLEEVRGDYWRAARLIHETLAVWRNRPNNPIEPDSATATNCQRPSRGIANPSEYCESALAWIQAECAKMYAELQKGCTLRYESGLLPENVQLTAEQEKLIQPALIAVSKARELHPALKKEIIGHICSIITTSLKK